VFYGKLHFQKIKIQKKKYFLPYLKIRVHLFEKLIQLSKFSDMAGFWTIWETVFGCWQELCVFGFIQIPYRFSVLLSQNFNVYCGAIIRGAKRVEREADPSF
jgi:hypothetical protein